MSDPMNRAVSLQANISCVIIIHLSPPGGLVGFSTGGRNSWTVNDPHERFAQLPD